MAVQWSLLAIIFYVILLRPTAAATITTTTSDSDREIFMHPPSTLLTLDEAVRITMLGNFESRVQLERVYRARHRINVAIGRLIPNLNFTVVAAASFQAWEGLVFAGVGFLFPSHWFRWKESRLYLQAEKAAFATILANEVNSIEILFYRIQALQFSLIRYQKYIKLLNRVIEAVKQHIPETKRVEAALRKTIDLKLELMQDFEEVKQTLAEVLPELWIALALNPSDWRRYSLAKMAKPPSPHPPELDSDSFFSTARERSQELKSLDFLIAASRASTYARYFDFAEPTATPHSGLGFGYFSYIKIGKSYTRELIIRKAQAASALHSSLDRTLAVYNTAIRSEPYVKEQFENGRRLFYLLQRRLYTEKYFSDDTEDAIEIMITAEARMGRHRFDSLIAKSQLRRILWQGPWYQTILEIAAAKKPMKHLNMWQRLENLRLKKLSGPR